MVYRIKVYMRAHACRPTSSATLEMPIYIQAGTNSLSHSTTCRLEARWWPTKEGGANFVIFVRFCILGIQEKTNNTTEEGSTIQDFSGFSKCYRK